MRQTKYGPFQKRSGRPVLAWLYQKPAGRREEPGLVVGHFCQRQQSAGCRTRVLGVRPPSPKWLCRAGRQGPPRRRFGWQPREGEAKTASPGGSAGPLPLLCRLSRAFSDFPKRFCLGAFCVGLSFRAVGLCGSQPPSGSFGKGWEGENPWCWPPLGWTWTRNTAGGSGILLCRWGSAGARVSSSCYQRTSATGRARRTIRVRV